ncbi:MAG: metal-dependent transcriptional regulator [Acidobacteria bacterium]|nr:metal-dependent transcriptional regulator [Acidobacteriota bacterium]
MLTHTAEDYLERIYMLSLRLERVKSSDIAKEFGIRTPSVISALKLLKEKGFVHYRKHGAVTLSEKGMERALDVYDRHKTTYRFLRFVLGVPDGIASADACGMEHSVSPETADAMKDFFSFIRLKKDAGVDIQGEFQKFRKEKPTVGKRARYSDTDSGTRRLSVVKDGIRCVILKLDGDREVKRRLLDMGVIPGETVEIRNRGPLGFPIEILIQGYVLTLRRDEAESVIVREA